MKKIKGIYNKIIDYTAVALFIILTYVSFHQVITRFLFSPPAWTEELSRYLFIWVTFIGVAIAFRTHAHLGVDYFVNLVSKSANKFIYHITNIILIAVLAVIAYKGYEMSQQVQNQLSPVLRISMMYAYMAIPVGLTLSLIEVIWNMFHKQPENEKVTHDGN